MKTITPYFICLIAALLWGCSREEEPHGHEHGPSCQHGEHGHDHDDHDHGDSCDCGDGHDDTDGEQKTLHIRKDVQKLLGLTCVTAEKRNTLNTVRFPGRFEVDPGARRVYSAFFDGIVEARVRPYQRVAAGDVLFRLVAPEWVQQSGQLRDAESALALAQTEAQVLSERLNRLTTAGTRNAELDMALKLKTAEVARAEVTLQTVRAARQAVLTYHIEEDGALVMKAREAGVVERLEISEKDCPLGACDCSGAEAWVQGGTAVMSVVREDGVRFRADGLLSELSFVNDGLRGFVMPTRAIPEKVEGTLSVAWSADADARTRPVYLTLAAHPPWVRPGVLGVLNVVVETSEEDSVAVPLSCVVEDGLRRVVFVRDAQDDEAFIRTEVSLGVSDGEWVEVGGVKDGATVVLHGAYELKLVSPSEGGASVKAAGHFHADGQFHEGTH